MAEMHHRRGYTTASIGQGLPSYRNTPSQRLHHCPNRAGAALVPKYTIAEATPLPKSGRGCPRTEIHQRKGYTTASIGQGLPSYEATPWPKYTIAEATPLPKSGRGCPRTEMHHRRVYTPAPIGQGLPSYKSLSR